MDVHTSYFGKFAQLVGSSSPEKKDGKSARYQTWEKVEHPGMKLTSYVFQDKSGIIVKNGIYGMHKWCEVSNELQYPFGIIFIHFPLCLGLGVESRWSS